MHDDLKDLDKVLAGADEKTLDEIIRQAETFLGAQLQSGIAADQRAITFASITFAVIALALGAYVTAAYSEHGAGNLGWVVFPMTVGLIVSAGLAAFTSRPVDWRYSGSNPKHWRDEVQAKVSHGEALAGQAKLYAKGIAENRKTLDLNAALMRWSLISAGASLLFALMIAGILGSAGCL